MMPWDQSQPPRPQRPPVPPAGPPNGVPYTGQNPNQMRPDIPPVTARNPQTGETVSVDIAAELREAIRQAVTGAVVDNKDNLIANGQRAIQRAAQGQKPTMQFAAQPKEDDGENIIEAAGEAIEEAWTGGPITTRTFVQGMAVDVGFALMATLATVMSPNFNMFDKEAWTLVGVLMLKTVIQTGMSFMMKLKVN